MELLSPEGDVDGKNKIRGRYTGFHPKRSEYVESLEMWRE
jgi:hypothetical protein